MNEQSSTTLPSTPAAGSRRETGDNRAAQVGGFSLAAALGGTLLSISTAVSPGAAETAVDQGKGHGLEYA
jgi:hypothetical protein